MAPYKFNPVLIDLKYFAPKALLDPKRAQMAPNKFNLIPKYLKDFFPKTLDLKSPTFVFKSFDLKRTQITPFQFNIHILETFLFKSTEP
jgi:hypothetical protein